MDKYFETSNSGSLKFLGNKVFDDANMLELVLRFGFNLLVVFIIMGMLYYSKGGRKEYFFTSMVIGMVVFILCFLLNNIKLQLGFALGLFAVFGIIRYRTDPIPTKEMTYLFAIIGVSILNALSNKKVSYAEIIFTNAALVILIGTLEHWFNSRAEMTIPVVYEKIKLIKPSRRADLIEDLTDRMGVDVKKVDIKNINLLKDTANLIVTYKNDSSEKKVNKQNQDEVS